MVHGEAEQKSGQQIACRERSEQYLFAGQNQHAASRMNFKRATEQPEDGAHQNGAAHERKEVPADLRCHAVTRWIHAGFVVSVLVVKPNDGKILHIVVNGHKRGKSNQRCSEHSRTIADISVQR